MCSIMEGAGFRQGDPAAALLQVDYGRKQILERVADFLDYDFSSYLRSVRPYLEAAQIGGLLKAGHAVGAHSIDHPRYGELPFEEQLRQTFQSVDFVKRRFGVAYGAFAFPNSDANVSRAFFREVFSRGGVDACFGNRGLLEDSVGRVIQRTSMEKTAMPAQGILGKAYARRLVRRSTGRLIVER